MELAHDALVMVVDGGKMLLFRNEGDGAYPNLKVEEAQEELNPPDHEQGTDAPGRAFSSVGSARSAVENTDFHRQAEDELAADVVKMLNRRALANEYEKLIIVAPPTMLGEMRKHYHKALEQRLIGEIAKDMTGHPTPDIERAIAQG